MQDFVSIEREAVVARGPRQYEVAVRREINTRIAREYAGNIFQHVSYYCLRVIRRSRVAYGVAGNERQRGTKRSFDTVRFVFYNHSEADVHSSKRSGNMASGSGSKRGSSISLKSGSTCKSLAFIISQYSASISIPTLLNPARFAATKVDPLPANGSMHVPPGGVMSLMR